MNRFALRALAGLSALATVAFSPFAALGQAGQVDDLPRHGVIGLVVAPFDPSKPVDPKSNPPVVKTVVPGGAGGAAGLQAGDIVRELDGRPVVSDAKHSDLRPPPGEMSSSGAIDHIGRTRARFQRATCGS